MASIERMHESASGTAAVEQATPANATNRDSGAWRISLLAGSALLVASALLLNEPAAHWRSEAELFTLLRGMAFIKAALALLAVAAIWWRLGSASAPRRLAVAYVGAAWAMAFAAGLIWQLSAIVPASALFHIATIALLVTAWRDVEPRAAERSAGHLREHDRQRPAEGHGAGQRTDDRVARLPVNPAADQPVDEEVRHDDHGDDQQEEQLLERQRYG